MPNLSDRVRDVADTAFMVAGFRALETERSDALFRDPLAARLAGERGMDLARAMAHSRMRAWPVAIRTVIIDEIVRAATERVLVITEGVIPYLTEDDVGALADDLHAAANVEGWVVDHIPASVQRFRERAGTAMRNAPFRFNPEDWLSFFETHGWQVGEMHGLARTGARLGRPIPLPRPMLFAMGLARRIRGERGQDAGYALLRRKD